MSLQTPERIQTACEFLKGLDISDLLRDPVPTTSEQDSSRSPPDAIPSLSNRSVGSLGTTNPLTIALTNLSPMHSPGATSSLYASPKPSHRIYSFAQRLHDIFQDAGLLLPSPNKRPLRLHATLVNTIYAKRSAVSGKNRWRKGSGKIDAVEVIEKFGETTWAKDVRLEKVAICEMGAEKVKDKEGNVVDEVYKEIASVLLP